MGARNPGLSRPEATAQVLAMQFLRMFRLDLDYDKVDWEVGPLSTTDLSHTTPEPPGAPGDPCDENAPGFVKDNKHWRIDIVVNQREIIEVKRYRDRAKVEKLNCYVTRVEQAGVELRKSKELNAIGWRVPFYVVTGSPPWVIPYCAWAPSDSPGHVYFAPVEETPVEARCLAPEVAKLLLVLADEARRHGIARSLVRDLTPPAVVPPFIEAIPDDDEVPVPQWSVEVLQDPDAVRHVRFEYGDGTEETVTVDRGEGSQLFTFSRELPVGSYTQQAVIEGEQSATGDPLVFQASTEVRAPC